MPRAIVLVLVLAGLLASSAWAQEEPAVDHAKSLLGRWQRTEPAPKVGIEFLEDRLVVTEDEASTSQPVRYHEGAIETQSAGAWTKVPYDLEEDRLTLHFPDGAWKLERLAEAPEFEPLPLGQAKEIPPERLQALQTEFRERLAKDQAVRRAAMGGRRPDPSAMAKMREIDSENTKRLIELMAELGWIDAGRFGRGVANAAFLIVQHSGNVRLMRTALPLIEKDVEAGLLDGGSYALLYDRTQLMTGGKQRYGSQVSFDPATGKVIVLPLEDEARVDEFRRQVGLPPLEAYIEMIKRAYGRRRPAPPPEPEDDEPDSEESDG